MDSTRMDTGAGKLTDGGATLLPCHVISASKGRTAEGLNRRGAPSTATTSHMGCSAAARHTGHRHRVASEVARGAATPTHEAW
jgi:hypothetical protein